MGIFTEQSIFAPPESKAQQREIVIEHREGVGLGYGILLKIGLRSSVGQSSSLVMSMSAVRIRPGAL